MCLCLDELWRGKASTPLCAEEPVHSPFLEVIIFLHFSHIIISTITLNTAWLFHQFKVFIAGKQNGGSAILVPDEINSSFGSRLLKPYILI